LPAIGPQGLRGGFLVAWDPVTQKERWRVEGGGGSGGGTVTTAGNLVFQTINDGRLLAYSADEGTKLLEIQTGQRGMGPPITFELDGRQYVSLMGGQGQRGGGAPGGNAPPPAPPASVAPALPAMPAALPRIYTFVLDGTAAVVPGAPAP
jgi:sugar lactone lactonase YvrE